MRAGTPSVSVVAPSLDELSSTTRAALAVLPAADARPRVIVLSGFANAERDALRACTCALSGARRRVRSLMRRSVAASLPNASILETPQYHNSCTHLIVKKPNHCEKFLAACAARVWVLKSQFLQDCAAARAWLPEHQYEWTAADAAVPTDHEMYRAPSLCRLRTDAGASAGSAGCFAGVVCVLEKGLPKREAFMRVVLAGGATVVDELADVADGAFCVHVRCKDTAGSGRRNVTVVDVEALVAWLVNHAAVKSKLKEAVA